MSEVKSEVVNKVSEEVDTEKSKEPNQLKPLKNLLIDEVDVSFAANEVFDLLPESYETLPLEAITDAFFGAEVSQIVLSEMNGKRCETDAHGLLNAAIRYDLDISSVEKAVMEARRHYEEADKRKEDLYRKIADKVLTLSELEIQRFLSDEKKRGVEHAVRL